MQTLQEVVAEPIVALGAAGTPFADIFTPLSALGQARVGVTAQFLENAGTYHARYSDTAYWRMLLDAALARIDAPAPRTIIDIGSGSGNSVLPLLAKFPDAYVVASDISPNLLAILRDYLANQPGGQARLGLLCADASRVRFTPGCADLVVGAAILHHILDPETVIERAFTALKPGGWAIFFEPFRAGSSLLTLAYKQVLREAKHRTALTRSQREALDALARIVRDYDTRVAMSREQAKALDDKWLFDRAYFESLAQKHGWQPCQAYSLQNGRAPVRAQTISYLRLAAQLDATALPDWAWHILDEFDAQLSDEVRQSAWMEAVVLLQKPCAPDVPAPINVDETNPFDRWYWSPECDRQGLFLHRCDDASIELLWCGFAADGTSKTYTATFHPRHAGDSYRGTLVDRPTTLTLTGDGLCLQPDHGPALHFQRFLTGDAPASPALHGVFDNTEAAECLLIEQRAGLAHAARVRLAEGGRVLSGELHRGKHGWRSTLTEYRDGPSPFTATALPPRPSDRQENIHLFLMDDDRIALVEEDDAVRVYRRRR